MQLHPSIEKFYLSILDYAGLSYNGEILENKNPKLGDFTIDNKFITLPYHDNLKNPNGKSIFHLLNESYVKPETALFNLYKKRLICEINLKIVQLFTVLAHIATSVELQGKIKNAKLLELVSEFKEVDMVFIENLVKLIKHSKDKNDESFIVDIFLKKNGEIDNIPFAATGKINFILYTEVKRALDDASRDYKVFNYKMRKKDLNILFSLFNTVFPSIDNQEEYVEGTDNKVFRYLNILLKTSYLITDRLNELAELVDTLADKTLDKDDLGFNLEWVTLLEELYGLTGQIRLIPNQTDTSIAEPTVHHMPVNENKIVDNTPSNVNIAQPPIYQPPPMVMPQQSGYPQSPAQVQPQQYMQSQTQPDPNDVLKALTNTRYNPQMQMPNYPTYPTYPPNVQMQPNTPAWMQQELMQQPGMQQNAMQQPWMPQQSYPMGQPIPYPQMPYGMQQQPYMGGYQQPGYQQPGVLNPTFVGKAPANF